MTLDQINFDALRPYDGKTTKSFEQLIYQLARNTFGHLGKMTAIDGSGGDGGVEFFLTLPNGDVWGWQCKFYENSGRLYESNRTGAIEQSLRRACQKYPALTKWSLCQKTDLTSIGRGSKGKFRNGERGWFDTELPKSIPDHATIQLEYIGLSEILRYLSKPSNVGIRSFFFGELEVSHQWFMANFESNAKTAKQKFDRDLHTIDPYIEAKLLYLLEDKLFVNQILSIKQILKFAEQDCYIEIEKLETDLKLHPFETDISERTHTINVLRKFGLTASQVYQKLFELNEGFASYDKATISIFNIEETLTEINDYLTQLYRHVNVYRNNLENDSCRKVRIFFEKFQDFVTQHVHEPSSEAHIVGSWGVGKTHLSYSVAEARLQQGLPAIFITADRFNDESSLEAALLNLLAIPSSYSINDLLDTLDLYGRIVGCKIPIIFDALNETIYQRYFSEIWSNHLAAFTAKIEARSNLMLITTFRESYQKNIWRDQTPKHVIRLDGFSSYVLAEAVEKYFRKYRLIADLKFTYLERFERPIFLKLYCEVNNPGAERTQEIEVNIEADSNDQIFSKYFDQINTRITSVSAVVRRTEPFVKQSMNSIGKFLWDSNQRQMTANSFYQLLDGDRPYEKGRSRSDLLIDEELLIARDIKNDVEYISFTYEVMSGYVIAKYLVTQFDLSYFRDTEDFVSKFDRHGNLHPLHEDILFELSLLFPRYMKTKLHVLFPESRNKYLFKTSTTALWSMQGADVDHNDREIILDVFTRSFVNKELIIKLCHRTLSDTEHPFNARFFSEILLKMTVTDRDLAWTEYVRKNSHQFLGFLDHFATQSRTASGSKKSTEKFILNAEYIQWLLTSSNRKIRDLATQALFYFGINFPESIADLTFRSLCCNDPYLWERTLGVMYGVILERICAKNYNLLLLQTIAKRLFNLIFARDAPNYMTHIVARDYALQSILSVLRLQPSFLTSAQKKLLEPPYNTDPQILLPTSDDIGVVLPSPLSFAFSEYTIGTLVDREENNFQNEENALVTRQVSHRINQLGWRADLFTEVDKEIDQMSRIDLDSRKLIERYGKKYSWIAFYEVAGHRSDRNLLKNEFNEYRLTISTEIDVCFPQEQEFEATSLESLLGRKTTPLKKWLSDTNFPAIDSYLQYSVPDSDGHSWVCLDGFISQRDIDLNRKIFLYIRSIIVDQEDYEAFMNLMNKQVVNASWLPDKRVHENIFSGEMYLIANDSIDNSVVIEFETGRTTTSLKKGDEDYYGEFEFDSNGKMFYSEPEMVRRQVPILEKFKATFPVMEYAWNYDQKDTSLLQRAILLSNEVVNTLGINFNPNSVEFTDSFGRSAMKAKIHVDNVNRHHNLTYIRKDLLDQFLQKKGKKLVLAAWCLFRRYGGRRFGASWARRFGNHWATFRLQ